MIQTDSIQTILAQACIVDETVANTIYCGFQCKRATEAQAKWAILKITITNGVIKKQWANASRDQNLIWNDRAGFDYFYKLF